MIIEVGEEKVMMKEIEEITTTNNNRQQKINQTCNVTIVTNWRHKEAKREKKREKEQVSYIEEKDDQQRINRFSAT